MASTRGMGRLLGLLVMVAGCASTTPAERAGGRRSMSDLVFLTRDGCVNTVTMRARLDEALQALGRPISYHVIDADSLPHADPRGGYGTPTVLYAGVDLFGLDEPPVPHPAPT